MKAVWSRLWGIPVNRCEGLIWLLKCHSVLTIRKPNSLFACIRYSKPGVKLLPEMLYFTRTFPKALDGD